MARRPTGLVALWLLTAMLAALGVSGPLQRDATAPPGAGVVIGSATAEAVPPAGAAGRPLAEPSLVNVHGPAEFLAFGTAPPSAPTPALVHLSYQHIDVTSVARAAWRPSSGDRAPPVRQADL